MAAHVGVSRIDQPNVPAISVVGAVVAAFFLAWLALVFVLGSAGAFVGARGAPPLALLIALLAPISLYVFAYLAIPSLRSFILSADLRVIAGIQAWRWAGFGFLTLYAYKVLPGIFAWPAGLGDMAIGVTAPFVLATLLRRPDFAASTRFVAWNVSGILDLALALSIGAIGPMLVPQFYGAVSTDPLVHMPLVLIPTFLVPTFLMLHLTALLQARRLRRPATP
jgi:hypothetical protein